MKTIKFRSNAIPLLIMVLSMGVLASCQDDMDKAPVKEKEQSIVDIVVNDNNFSILEAALVKAGLVETLSGAGPFTVFAPTNAAFEAAGITSLDDYTAEQLTPILLYHVVGGRVPSSSLTNGQAVSTVAEEDFFLSLGDKVVINGTSTVTKADVAASNGIIHVIDRTLVPPTDDIVEIAVGAGFTKLAEALTEAGLVETLQGDGPFTVFAPTDAAFDALYARLGVTGPAEIDEATLEAVLTYHVLGARVFSSDLSDGAMPETLQTGTVTVNLGENVTVTDVDSGSPDAVVTATDILGSNGVIHVIDQILIPVEL
jgi:transforming growth factor-beta-induced protein